MGVSRVFLGRRVELVAVGILLIPVEISLITDGDSRGEMEELRSGKHREVANSEVEILLRLDDLAVTTNFVYLR